VNVDVDVDVDVMVDAIAPRATRTNSATSRSAVRRIHQDPEEVAVLAHKKLDVYRCALEFLTIAIRIELPRGYAPLGDQLRRAALSIPLNIAEAVGKPGDDDRARFFATARGSAMECSAIFDSCSILGAISAQDAAKADELLERIVAMLTKMCR
jgi:four helix bundle protein